MGFGWLWVAAGVEWENVHLWLEWASEFGDLDGDRPMDLGFGTGSMEDVLEKKPKPTTTLK